MIAEKMKPYVKNNSAIRMMFEEGNRQSWESERSGTGVCEGGYY